MGLRAGRGIGRLFISLNASAFITVTAVLVCLAFLSNTVLANLLTVKNMQAVLPQHAADLPKIVIILAQTFCLYLVFKLANLGTQMYGGDSHLHSSLNTKPVTVADLAAWPMLFAVAAITVVWIFLALFVLEPMGLTINIVTSTYLLIVEVPLLMAYLWLTYKVPSLLAGSFIILGGFGYLNILAVTVPVWTLLGIGAICLSLSFVVTYVLISRSRSGPGLASFRRPRQITASERVQNSLPFRSAVAAHFWFELKGKLPSLIGSITLLCVTYLLVGLWLDPAMGLKNLILVIFVWSIFLMNPEILGPKSEVLSFCAVRPMENSSFISSIYRAALVRSCILWAVALPFLLVLWRLENSSLPSLSQIVTGAVYLCIAIAVSWKLQLINLCFAATGRPWIRPIVYLAAFTVAALYAVAIISSGLTNPLVAGVLIATVLRMAALPVLLGMELHLHQLSFKQAAMASLIWICSFFAAREAIYYCCPGGSSWGILATCLSAWLMPGCTAILPIPALAWNRHRR
jgi:hypothetical protein